MAIATTTLLAGASVGLSAYSAYSASKGRQAQAQYNAEVAEANAEIARQNARDVEMRGRQAVFDQRRAVARALSDTRAATAASGLEVDVAGTTGQDLVRSMAEAGELDVMRLRNNIEREKRQAMVQAQNYEARAGQFQLQRRTESPFRSALVAGVGSANQNADILFG